MTTPESHARSNRAWYLRNHEEQVRLNYERTRARGTTYFAEKALGYYRADPTKFFPNAHLQAHRRRARVAGLPDTITAEELADTLAYFHGRCAYCLRPPGTIHWDHMVAVTRDGGSTQENMVPSCRSCNSRKSAKPIWSMVNVAA